MINKQKDSTFPLLTQSYTSGIYPVPVVLSIYLSLYTATGPRGHSRQGGRFSLHVIMLLKIPVNSKAHVRMHTCDIFLRVFFMNLFGMWRKKPKILRRENGNTNCCPYTSFQKLCFSKSHFSESPQQEKYHHNILL